MSSSSYHSMARTLLHTTILWVSAQVTFGSKLKPNNQELDLVTALIDALESVCWTDTDLREKVRSHRLPPEPHIIHLSFICIATRDYSPVCPADVFSCMDSNLYQTLL